MACLGWSLAQEPYAKGGKSEEKSTDEKRKGKCWLLGAEGRAGGSTDCKCNQYCIALKAGSKT